MFNRNAETIMIDNKERIDEMNDVLRDAYRIIDDPEIIEQQPILDPGRIIFSRKTAQITNSSPSVVDQLDLKRVVDFSGDAMTAMYRIAPLDTWAIFVSQDQEQLAKQLLMAFRRQIVKLEKGDPFTKAPKIFAVPVAQDEKELRQTWKQEIT